MMKLKDAMKDMDPAYYDAGNLKTAILARIDAFERRRSMFWLSTSLAASVLALGGSFYGAQAVLKSIAASDIGSYASLVFSDTSSLALYWKEFLYTVSESLPTLGITMMLGGVFLFLATLRSSIRYGTAFRKRAFARIA